MKQMILLPQAIDGSFKYKYSIVHSGYFSSIGNNTCNRFSIALVPFAPRLLFFAVRSIDKASLLIKLNTYMYGTN
jgi:hypothetical protein